MMEVSVYTKGAAPSPGRKIKYAGESVRALPVRIVTVGKKRSKGVQMLFEEYKEKLKYYCCINDVQIKSNPKNTGDVRTQIESEDTIVMQNISPQDWVVVLDERGLDIASEGMAQLVGDAGKTGSSTLVFCIGGPYGHGPKLRERADSMDNSQGTEISPLARSCYDTLTVSKQFAQIPEESSRSGERASQPMGCKSSDCSEGFSALK